MVKNKKMKNLPKKKSPIVLLMFNYYIYQIIFNIEDMEIMTIVVELQEPFSSRSGDNDDTHCILCGGVQCSQEKLYWL